MTTFINIDIPKLSADFVDGIAESERDAHSPLSFWSSVIAGQLALMVSSIGERETITLVAHMLESAAERLHTDEEAHVALPDALYKDGLTGFYRKTFFAAEYPQYGRGENSLMLIRWDFEDSNLIEHFEHDAAIRWVADVIRRSIRTVDVVCRWSDFEFLILLPRTNVELAKLVANRICGTPHDTGLRPGIVSIGIAVAINDESFGQVFGRADWALYSAQVSEKHNVEIG